MISNRHTEIMQCLNICQSKAQSIDAHILDIRGVVDDSNIHMLGILGIAYRLPSFRAESEFRILNYFECTTSAKNALVLLLRCVSQFSLMKCVEQLEVYQKRPESLFLELLLGHCKILCSVIHGPTKVRYWSDVD